jgi:hypothetical protein
MVGMEWKMSTFDITWTVVGAIVVGLLAYAVELLTRSYCLNKIKEAKAFSPETAVTREEARIPIGLITGKMTKRNLQILVKKNKVKVTENGRYYVAK